MRTHRSVTVRVDPRFGDRAKEIKRIIRGLLYLRKLHFDDSVLITVLPCDDYEGGTTDWERGRQVAVGCAFPNCRAEVPEPLRPSVRYQIALWLPVDGPDQEWPLWEYGSPRRYSDTKPPDHKPRGWPVFRYECWQDELVAVLMHEAKHILDFSWDDTPARPEMEAEKEAFRSLESFQQRGSRSRMVKS